MGKARRGRREEGPFTGRYEGPEVLSALLAQAGSPHEAEEVAEHFREAQAAGEPRSDVIPALFPEEPRFATPEDARRLYENLFGLWDRISAGLGAADDAPEAVPSSAARPPDRGSLDGRELTPGFVEQAWRWLAALPVRDEARLRDRFGGAQPDLLAWLDQVELPDTGETAAHDLVFETWAMLDQGVDDRLGAVDWSELRELEAEPPPLESVQPALAVYVAEQLDNLADEEPDFGEAERAQVERVIAAAAAALTRVVAED